MGFVRQQVVFSGCLRTPSIHLACYLTFFFFAGKKTTYNSKAFLVSTADVFGAFGAINGLCAMADGLFWTFRGALYLMSMLSHFFFLAQKKPTYNSKAFFWFPGPTFLERLGP